MPLIRPASALLLAAMLTACVAPDPALPGAPAVLRVGFGTGFFVGNDVVATAAHVVRTCRRIDIWSGAVPEVQAAVLRVWREPDVAFLRAPTLAPAMLRKADTPARSGPLRAFGYSGATGALRAEETAPLLVNGLARANTPADPREILWLQDPAIGHGWSGAPVLDGAGRVAGMIVAVMPDPADAGEALDAKLPGIAIATGLAGLHLPAPADMASDDPERAVVHVRCVE